MAAAASFHERLKAVPGLKAALVSDPEGVVLLQAGDAAHDEAMKKYAATFLLTAERASKLHLGKNKTLTALYGADRNSQPRATRSSRNSQPRATRNPRNSPPRPTRVCTAAPQKTRRWCT